MNQNTQTTGRSGVVQKGNDNDRLYSPPANWHEACRPRSFVVGVVVCRPHELGDGKLRKE